MSRITLLLAAVALSLAPALAFGQDKALPIAVINLDKVFNNYKKHAERLQPVSESAKELNESVQVRQVEIETAANQLRKAMPGTPEQQRLVQQIQKLRADMEVFLNAERQKIQKREVSALISTQKDVDEQIKKLCKERGLKLVLRQNSAPEENQPLQEVIKNLNRDVIYQDGLDITDDVIKALNDGL